MTSCDILDENYLNTGGKTLLNSLMPLKNLYSVASLQTLLHKVKAVHACVINILVSLPRSAVFLCALCTVQPGGKLEPISRPPPTNVHIHRHL